MLRTHDILTIMVTKQLQGIKYCMSDISDGNMSFRYGEPDEVLENRRSFLHKQNLTLDDCVVLKVQDEDVILTVDGKSKGKGIYNPDDAVSADALITQEKGLALFLFTADCCPIVYYDPALAVIALAHMGWKSTQQRLASKVIKRMEGEYGSNPDKVIVLFGPSIRKDSYIVMNPEQKEIPEWEPFLEDIFTGETKVNLIGFNRNELLQSGVLSEHIIIDPHDTAVSKQYYSHYQSVRTGESEGRFATVIALK